MKSIIFFWVLLLSSFCFKAYGQLKYVDKLVLDTTVFDRNFIFQSTIQEKINKSKVLKEKCTNFVFYNDKNAKAFIRRFNKELKTDKFSKVKVIVGTFVTLKESDESVFISEWHFNSEKTANEIVSLLQKLNKGRFRYIIIPRACYWKQSKQIMSIIVYTELFTGNPDVKALYEEW